MNPIVALDDTSFDSPMITGTNIESDYPEESIDQLIERANSQLTAVRSKIKTAAPPVSTVTVRATSDMEAAIDREIPPPIIDIMDATDDDVIFVGEENIVINLCSPDKGPRSSKSVLGDNNGRQKKGNCTATKAAPHLDDCDSATNSVICAVCMESSVGKMPHSTKCGHIFCGDCIKEAIKITKKCPLCNKSLTVKNLMPVFI